MTNRIGRIFLVLGSVAALVLTAYMLSRVACKGRQKKSAKSPKITARISEADAEELAALKKRIEALERTTMRLFAMIVNRNRKGGGVGKPGSGTELNEGSLNTEEGRKRLFELVAQAEQRSKAETRRRWQQLLQHKVHKVVEAFAEANGLDANSTERLKEITDKGIKDLSDLHGAYTRGELKPEQFEKQKKTLNWKVGVHLRALLGHKLAQKFAKARSGILNDD